MFPQKSTNSRNNGPRASDTKPGRADPARHAGGKLTRSKPNYVPDDPLLTAAEAAIERGQALSTFWRDVHDGRVPAAYYPSPRCPRWRRSEIHAGLEATRSVPGRLTDSNQENR